ncbi:hypothetical protein Tco_1127341 [Tanacetum coccineum]
MAQLKYCDKHNQVGFLLKPTESAGYTEIVDFLRRSKLRYALTHNPPIYDSLVKQFWQTATARTLADGTQQLNATIDSIEYTITEESVRRQLQLADASGINMLQNEEIFEGLQNIGSKSGGWDQFGSNIATALICLSTGRDFNFSKLIFDGMISNLKSKSKSTSTKLLPPSPSHPVYKSNFLFQHHLSCSHLPLYSHESQKLEKQVRDREGKRKNLAVAEASEIKKSRPLLQTYQENTFATPGNVARVRARLQEEQISLPLEAAQILSNLKLILVKVNTVRQIDLDALLARRLVGQDEVAAQRCTLPNEFELIQARLMQNLILAESFNKKKGSNYSIEDRANFYMDTILAAQRKFLAEQKKCVSETRPQQYLSLEIRCITISKPYTRSPRYLTFVASLELKKKIERAIKTMTLRKLLHKEEEKKDELSMRKEDLKIIYELVMEEYKDNLPEGFDRMLWGDLMIMFNQGDTADFWDTQQN